MVDWNDENYDGAQVELWPWLKHSGIALMVVFPIAFTIVLVKILNMSAGCGIRFAVDLG